MVRAAQGEPAAVQRRPVCAGLRAPYCRLPCCVCVRGVFVCACEQCAYVRACVRAAHLQWGVASWSEQHTAHWGLANQHDIIAACCHRRGSQVMSPPQPWSPITESG